MSVRIITCTCNTGSASKFQDEKLGKGKRVANLDSKAIPQAKCTCCGSKQ